MGESQSRAGATTMPPASRDSHLKLKRSTFTGSLCGTGPVIQSVWVHVLIQADWVTGEAEINPIIIAAAIGGGVTAEEVEAAIAMFCAPDPKSRTKAFEGRRLEQTGEFIYKILNWEDHQKPADMTERREQVRLAVARYRQRQKAADVQDKSNPVQDSPPHVSKRLRKDDEPEGDAEFMAFFAAYPNKKKRLDAFKAWRGVEGKRPGLEQLLAKLGEFRASREWTEEGGKYIPAAGPWLRGRRWQDELQVGVKETPEERRKAAIQRMVSGQTGPIDPGLGG